MGGLLVLLKNEGISQAASVLAGESWIPTPLMPAKGIGNRLGIDLWFKREDLTPVGSFKLRGAIVTMSNLRHTVPAKGVYVASSGNYGLAIAFAGQRHSVPVTVFLPDKSVSSKMEGIDLCGALIVQHGEDFDAAKDFARESAARDGAVFWEDGSIEEMALGAGTIGTELVDYVESWDYVIVPLGNGSLAKGVSTVVTECCPDTRVIGVVSSAAPAMYHAILGEGLDESTPTDTLADGLAIRVPISGIVEELKTLLSDVWMVEESALLPAVRSLMDLEQLMAEPSSASLMVAIVDHARELAGKKVAAVITGAHLPVSLLPRIAVSEGLI